MHWIKTHPIWSLAIAAGVIGLGWWLVSSSGGSGGQNTTASGPSTNADDKGGSRIGSSQP